MLSLKELNLFKYDTRLVSDNLWHGISWRVTSRVLQSFIYMYHLGSCREVTKELLYPKYPWCLLFPNSRKMGFAQIHLLSSFCNVKIGRLFVQLSCLTLDCSLLSHGNVTFVSSIPFLCCYWTAEIKFNNGT